MGYLRKAGNIGEYHGLVVWGMDRKVYDKRESYKSDIIYCLSDVNSDIMMLVLNDKWIGNMTDGGSITEFYKPKDYNRAYKKEKKVEAPKKERGKRVEVKPVIEEQYKFEEFVATSVDEILTAAINDDWYKGLMYKE